MALLDIVLHPHPSLYKPAKPVTEFDDALHTFLDDMAETMYAANGVGLAANQVDVLKRVILIDPSEKDEEPQLLELINPRIVSKSGEITWEEGCLSFPGVYEKVKRSHSCTVKYQDRDGNPQEISGEELLSVVLQHEIDHIDGVCFTQRMGMTKRRMVLKEFARLQRERALEAAEAKAEAAAASEESVSPSSESA